MLVDCHMHTPLCGHAVGDPLDYALAARDRGIELITVTCHIPMEWAAFGQAGIRMRRDQVDDYIRMVHAAAEQASAFGVEIRCGIEAEIFPDASQLTAMDEVLAAYEFDFVLGSLHAQCASYRNWLDAHVGEDNFTRVESYLRHVTEGAASGRYDSLAHPDVIRTYGVVESFEPAEHEPQIRKLLETAVAHDVCLEVNTSGLNKGDFEVHPDPLIIDWALAMGVRFTIGSDAHHPASVGQHFEVVLPMLKAKGLKTLHYFRRRERLSFEI